MTIKAVLFDLGGVLVRTEDGAPRTRQAEQLNRSRSDLEHLVFASPSSLDAQRGVITVEQHWENVQRELGLSEEDMGAFQESFWGGDRLDHTLVDYIRSLRPVYRTGLISNAFDNLRRVMRDTWKILDAFDAVVISSEAGVMKPDPRIYHLALDQLEVSPNEAVFVDDFRENVAGARAFGMHAVHFRSTAQALAELDGLIKS